MKYTNKKSGVSLIIAIVFVSAFMLVLAGLAEAQIKTIRNIGNRRLESQARYLKEGLEEMAGFVVAQHAAGWNPTTQEIQTIPNEIMADARDLGMNTCGTKPGSSSCADLQIIGRSRSGNPNEDSKVAFNTTTYFSVPAAFKVFENSNWVLKGTGSAAANCDPNIYGPGLSNFQADDPCHWNRLYTGESVEIPLFFYDDNGTLVKPIFTQFILRIRTPCDDLSSKCNPDQRIKLYPRVTEDTTQPFRNVRDPTPNDNFYDIDPVLVQWLITDENGTSTLLSNDRLDSNKIKRPPSSQINNVKENTELSAGRINDANPHTSPTFILGVSVLPYIVLEGDYKGATLDNPPQNIKNIIEFLNNNNIARPVLRLHFATRPKRDLLLNETRMSFQQLNDTATDVPFLEYQFLSTSQISDSKSTLTGWVQIGDFYKEFNKAVHRIPSLGGFVLETF